MKMLHRYPHPHLQKPISTDIKWISPEFYDDYCTLLASVTLIYGLLFLQPKLSMAKCRRNVENFLDACRKLGIPEADLCSPYDILQSDIRHIRKTVDTLLALGEKTPQSTSAFRSWDLIGFCLFHILFIVLMYITYHWNALTA
uniref:Calponin-homology (CH) domain-containing protein n=1 Tax=Chelonoidis abingdonii TaxID=106734 RepID=A0A8C0FWY6_CHEAB